MSARLAIPQVADLLAPVACRVRSMSRTGGSKPSRRPKPLTHGVLLAGRVAPAAALASGVLPRPLGVLGAPALVTSVFYPLPLLASPPPPS